MGECRGGDSVVNIGSKTDARFVRLEEHRDQLLPGIPDEIVVDHINTKLPWTELYVLSSVSPRWKQAMESHRVLAVRVHCPSAETVVVHNHIVYKL